MYGNNYPNDYENKNVVNGTAKEEKPENGNFSGQNTTGYHTGYNNTNHSGNGAYQYGNAYGTGTSYQNYQNKKEKTNGAGKKYWMKALVAVSLGLFFGICAGLGFFAVESVTDTIKGKNTVTTDEMAKAKQELNGVAETTINADETEETSAGNTDGAVVLDVSEVAARVMPAIVSINNTSTQTMSYFGQTLQSESTSVGSGIIVGESDTELLIVSNYHVVEESNKLLIQFVNGTEAEAQMKGSDPDMDLAVIAVSLDDVDAVTKDAIAVAVLGDSDSLAVGEPAIAIGNALGYGQSVTVGVVSALDRVRNFSTGAVVGKTDTAESGETFIQTDAAINPGNSGGALLNIKGEVIGINSNKIGGTVVEGMGYAIPISLAKPIIEELMLKETRAKVDEENKGYLGISQLTVVQEMAEVYGMPKGVYVSQVYEGTGAEAAGIVKGNIITELEGNKITSSEDLIRVLGYYAEGETVEVTIMQGSPEGWESKTVMVTLGGKI